MLLEVLSYLPASVLLGQCRHVCRYWRSLVDTRAVWLSILPYSHAKLWPVVRTCLPPDDDDDPRPCVLGRFCERRPLGRNLYPNPRGIGGEPRKGCPWDGLEAEGRGSRKPLGLVRGLGGQARNLGTNIFSFNRRLPALEDSQL